MNIIDLIRQESIDLEPHPPKESYRNSMKNSDHREGRTKTTKGQYSPVRLQLARLVNSLLYGTRFMLYAFLSNALPVS